MVSVDRLGLDNRDEPGLDGVGRGGHGGLGLAPVGMMEWARVVFTEPRVLKGVRAIDFVRVREEEPEMPEGFSRDKFELGKGVWIGGGTSEVSHQGVDRCFSEVGRSYGS
jgi:hypothetical protein